MRTHTRKMGKSSQGFRPRVPKRVFFCYQCNAAFRPLILHQFRQFFKQQTLIAFRMRVPVKKFPISAQGVFQVPKTAQNMVLYVYGRVFVIELQLKRHMWIMGIISAASRHPKDVPFVRESWWGTYVLGAISPRKSQNFGDFTIWADLIV